MSAPQAIPLSALTARISDAIAVAPELSGVWVVAETSDVRTSGGHCYMELIDKDPDTGAQLARARATIWASRRSRLSAAFRAATGSDITSDIKVMVQVSVAFHPVYGLSLNITDINPEYTLGDLLRRRREMIDRLRREGIIDLNRSLPWPDAPLRVAVISAQGAAGYGDFIDQLFTDPRRLRFSARLFEAVMQGEKAAPSIIAALERIAADDTDYDCVVIIRGGGATGDLAAFDSYELAANIAMFPLPVIIGIGHERDVTLLDYVANMRVKTPTAAAQWLIGRAAAALDRVQDLAAAILDAASARMSAAHRRLDFISGQLAPYALGAIERRRLRLDTLAALAETLSPQATLRRGFSITRADGRVVTSAAQIAPGTVVETTLADGSILSKTL